MSPETECDRMPESNVLLAGKITMFSPKEDIQKNGVETLQGKATEGNKNRQEFTENSEKAESKIEKTSKEPTNNEKQNGDTKSM